MSLYCTWIRVCGGVLWSPTKHCSRCLGSYHGRCLAIKSALSKLGQAQRVISNYVWRKNGNASLGFLGFIAMAEGCQPTAMCGTPHSPIWTELKVLCSSEWMFLIPFFWRKQKHRNVTKILQWESNPNGCSPGSCLTPGGRIVNWPATNLWSNIWSQECTSNLCFIHLRAVQQQQQLVHALPCMQGCQSHRSAVIPLGSEQALTLGWKQQVEGFLPKPRCLAKPLFPRESECVVSWTSPAVFAQLIVQLQVCFQLLLVSPVCIRPARPHMPDMRPECLAPVPASGTSGSDGGVPQVTPAEPLPCKRAFMHHWRRKWHSQARRQIVATHCVSQDHSCTLDSDFPLLRSRWGHALAAGRDVSVRNSYRK